MADERPRVGSALDAANDTFHDAYDAARGDERREAPVLVVLEDDLVVFRGGRRQDHHVTPRAFHVLKSAAHVPVGLFAAAHRHDEAAMTRMRRLATTTLGSLDGESDLDSELRSAIRDVLEPSRDYADGVDARAAFAEAMRAPLLKLTELATRLQLRALHEVVERVLADFDANERAELEVVVTGNHQARARSLGMQYFRKRLEDPEGAEERVAYAEGVEDADAALELVATRRVDAVIAEAFFGDPKRLQRDVLGDAVRDLLEATQLEAIR